MNCDFGFTGHYFHAPSGLFLAVFRAYDPNIGRWLSRDPMAEKGGINLYAYVGNGPITFIDPLGLVKWALLGKSVLGLVANGAVAIGGALLAETGIGAVAAVYASY
jgi:RHS repeat-associated protein